MTKLYADTDCFRKIPSVYEYRNGTAEKTKCPSLSQTEPINNIRLMSAIEISELSVQRVLAGRSMSYVLSPRVLGNNSRQFALKNYFHASKVVYITKWKYTEVL